MFEIISERDGRDTKLFFNGVQARDVSEDYTGVRKKYIFNYKGKDYFVKCGSCQSTDEANFLTGDTIEDEDRKFFIPVVQFANYTRHYVGWNGQPSEYEDSCIVQEYTPLDEGGWEERQQAWPVVQEIARKYELTWDTSEEKNWAFHADTRQPIIYDACPGI